ncbi:MAG: hypothetical protein IIY87_01920 [Bacteroidales bacterium]|nr:hypothetical protein [Bacteroidales bacterium]
MNFDRFKKVVVRDFNSTYQLYGLSMVIMMCVPVAVWLFGLAFKIPEFPPVVRNGILQFVVVLAAAISSMKIYKSCNLAGKGNYFALLPASLGEKFCSMMLYCFIVTPLAVFFGSYLVDTLLSILPFGPYKDFIWARPEWLIELDLGGYYADGGSLEFDTSVSTILKAISASSIFMFANTIFKKNKFIKTILWLMLISFVITIVVFPIVSHIDFNMDWLYDFIGGLTPAKLHAFVFWGSLLLNLGVAAIFSWLTYRRLKKMQY